MKIFVCCLITIILGIIVIVAVVKIPKTAVQGITSTAGLLSKDYTRLKYYGLGLTKSEGILGRIPIEFSFPTLQTYPDLLEVSDGMTTVILHKQATLDMCPNEKRFWKGVFSSHFSSGQIRFQGSGLFFCSVQGPSIATARIFEATYYKPDGSIGSQIISGNGSETVWSEGGIKLEEAFYHNGRWKYFQRFDQHGNMIFEKKRSPEDAF